MNKIINPKLGVFKKLEEIWKYKFWLWIPENQIENIIKYSNDINDIDLLTNTSDSKRFIKIDSLEKWYNNKWRYIFSIIWYNWKIIWFWQWRPSKEPLFTKILDKKSYIFIINNKKDIHTSWIRIYPNFRWKWLAKILLDFSHKYYKKIYPNFIMTIDINKSNIASQKSYEKAWYKIVWYWENQKTVESQKEERIVYFKYQ